MTQRPHLDTQPALVELTYESEAAGMRNNKRASLGGHTPASAQKKQKVASNTLLKLWGQNKENAINVDEIEENKSPAVQAEHAKHVQGTTAAEHVVILSDSEEDAGSDKKKNPFARTASVVSSWGGDSNKGTAPKGPWAWRSAPSQHPAQSVSHVSATVVQDSLQRALPSRTHVSATVFGGAKSAAGSSRQTGASDSSAGEAVSPELSDEQVGRGRWHGGAHATTMPLMPYLPFCSSPCAIQRRVLELVREGSNVFYTGNAGTGKTFLLSQILAGGLVARLGCLEGLACDCTQMCCAERGTQASIWQPGVAAGKRPVLQIQHLAFMAMAERKGSEVWFSKARKIVQPACVPCIHTTHRPADQVWGGLHAEGGGVRYHWYCCHPHPGVRVWPGVAGWGPGILGQPS